MIDVQNLSKSYDNNKSYAVDSVSFQVKRGEMACLIGTSGCGKTSLLKMINRLVEPSSGEIKIDGQSHRNSDPISWRRNIGYVIQKAGLLPHLTVSENIVLLPKLLERDPQATTHRLKETMEMVRMPYAEFKDRYPAELSGGQQQRVGIARALIEDPPLLLMDEPFGALDPITRNSLHKQLMEIQKELKKTILMVTHDLLEAKKLSDLVFIMDHGKVIQSGPMESIVGNPQSSFVEEFISEQLQ